VGTTSIADRLALLLTACMTAWCERTFGRYDRRRRPRRRPCVSVSVERGGRCGRFRARVSSSNGWFRVEGGDTELEALVGLARGCLELVDPDLLELRDIVENASHVGQHAR